MPETDPEILAEQIAYYRAQGQIGGAASQPAR
jgi:hypothetical protein